MSGYLYICRIIINFFLNFVLFDKKKDCIEFLRYIYRNLCFRKNFSKKIIDCY